MYIPQPAAYTNSIHNSNTKRKYLQWLKSIYQMDSYWGKIIYVDCPRLMQIYLVCRIVMGFILLSFWYMQVKFAIDIITYILRKCNN